jgi:hypothetical protein
VGPAGTIGAAIFAMALTGAAAAGDRVASVVGSGSSLPPQPAQLEPAAATLPPKPPQPVQQTKPADERILMLMLLSHTSFGPFGRLGQ